MNKRRVLLWVITVCLLAALIPSTVFAATTGWVKSGDNWYYYDDGYMYSDGVYQIGGNYYGFDVNGVMYAGTVFDIYDESGEVLAYYRANADGALYVHEWYEDENGNYYYYSADGKQCCDGVYQIGGNYYGFDVNGVMYIDTVFDIYDEAAEVWVYYRAKAYGTLYVHEWYQDENGNRYYYGAEGAGAEDFCKVGDAWYFFDNARMVTDQVVWSELYQAYYYISEDGKSSTKVQTNGWLQTGNNSYYFSDGEMYRSGVYQIGGNYYGFDVNGVMYAGTVFDIYDETAEAWVYYRAKAYGILYVHEWYQDENGNRYYYGAEGAGAEDFWKVGDAWYFFDNARMVTDQVVWSESYQAYYYISEDSKSSRAPTNGWWQAGDDYYYFSDGEMYRSGVYQIDGKYYGFDWNGIMYKATIFSVGHYDETQGIWVFPYYRAKADGTLYVNEWYQDENGNHYYYGAEGAGAEDFRKVGDAWYFFDNARMVTDQVVWSESYQAYYYISEDGKSSRAPTNGWWQAGDDYYYFSDGEMLTDTWKQEDDAWYYFQSSGIMATGTVNIDGQHYTFDDTGKLQNSDHSFTNYVSNGDATCVADGTKTATCDYDGCDATDTLTDTNSKLGHSFVNYVSNNDATCTADGTKTAKCERCDATDTRTDADSKLGHSFVNYVSNNDATCTADGTMTAKCDRCDTTDTVTDEGSVKGHEYATTVTAPTCTVQGYTIYFCGCGNSYVDDYVNALGHAFTNYISNNDATCTADGTKTAKCDRCDATDTQTDTDSKLGHSFVNYVSNNDATCIADGTMTAKCDRCDTTDTRTDIDSKLGHAFTNYISENNATYDADGTKTAKCDRCAVTDTVTDAGTKLVRNGWIADSGKWYYYENGVSVTGWKYVGIYWYYFNGKGEMLTGWQQVGGTWYYFQGGGKMVTGWQRLGNTWYFFHPSGAMATGWVKSGNVWYYFHSSGAMATGWVRSGSAWYYFASSGAMQTGWQQVGGQWYYFNGSGAMRTGWQRIGTTWYYFQSGGAMQTGWLKLGNTWYYFHGSGAMATGSLKIGAKTYNFNSSGACLNP